MKLKESEFSKWFGEQLKSVGGYIIPFTPSRYSKRGIPDRFVCHSSIPGGVWIEIKVDGNRLSAEQNEFKKEASKRGVNVVSMHATIDALKDMYCIQTRGKSAQTCPTYFERSKNCGLGILHHLQLALEH